ncbi:MAG TPA: Gfo/Idh/MocA family oxidoreductase [Fimbriimonadaceae bacterium]|jgi:predicted dehydrogenase
MRIGILGAGRIAGSFAESAPSMKRCEVVAIGSRELGKAQAFASAHAIPNAFGSYEELVASDLVDAVYIAGPNGMHKEWSLRSVAAGKHVLCEKPMALSVADAEEMFAAARANGVHLIEAFPFRFQPQTLAVLDFIRAGSLGEILAVTAGFGFTMNHPNDVRLDASIGGGAVWDVGSYVVNLSNAVFDAAPGSIVSTVRMKGQVDFITHAMLTYGEGRSSSVWCSFESQFYRGACIVGSGGVIEYGYPNHTDNADESSFVVRAGDESIRHEARFGSGFALEADALAALVAGEEFNGTTPAETIRNTETLMKILGES